MRIRSQSGFTAVEIAVVVAVVVVIGFLGYTFYNNYQQKQADAGESSQTADTTEAPAITTADDLDKADTVLNASDLEAASKNDLSEIDKDSNEF